MIIEIQQALMILCLKLKNKQTTDKRRTNHAKKKK